MACYSYYERSVHIVFSQFCNKYEYTRTKTDVVEHGNPVLFVSAGITRERQQQLGSTTRRQVDVVVSKVSRFPLEEAPPQLLALKEETVSYDLSTSEFFHLVELFEKNIESFYLFKSEYV